MRDLVPDEALRAALSGEMPSLPFSYFEQRVPTPAGWERLPCAYLLLSDAYRYAAAEARARLARGTMNKNSDDLKPLSIHQQRERFATRQ
jgi:hypothetical protein